MAQAVDEIPEFPAQIRKQHRWWRWLLALPFLFAAASILQVVALRFVDPPFSTFMAIRQFEAWGEGDWRFHVAYDWRDIDEISANVPVALVASEDQRFAEHYGFDLKAIEKAAKNNERGRRVRGGSTITQQLAKNLFLWRGQGYSRWLRKAMETWYTLLIETLWSKQRIMEVYVNVVEFGDGVYGAQAAARTFWKKDADRLGPADAARMAAVLPNPKRYSISRPGPYVQRRARAIQRQMRYIGGNGYLKKID